MLHAEWCLGESDLRRLRLLEHLADQGLRPQGLAAFYGFDEARTTEALADVQHLDRAGLVNADLSMDGIGGVAANLTTQGCSARGADPIRSRRAPPSALGVSQRHAVVAV